MTNSSLQVEVIYRHAHGTNVYLALLLWVFYFQRFSISHFYTQSSQRTFSLTPPTHPPLYTDTNSKQATSRKQLSYHTQIGKLPFYSTPSCHAHKTRNTHKAPNHNHLPILQNGSLVNVKLPYQRPNHRVRRWRQATTLSTVANDLPPTPHKRRVRAL